MSPASIIEFLLWLLIAASFTAMVTTRLKIPYTVALVIGGFAIDFFHVPITRALGEGKPVHLLTPEIILILFLPALLFQSGLAINARHLRENLVPIASLAIVGVVVATVITGYAVHWVVGLPVLPALLFGALISATDPISVVALFRNLGVSKRLSVIIEGESLFNDGTSVVVFQIILGGLASGELHLVDGIRSFVVVSLGGGALGLMLGYLASKATGRVDDARIEIMLTTILAYSSYLIAEHLHVSGVIATVAAGLMVGNFGAKVGMSARTRVALWSFWDYVSFVINSLVFLLIGIEVHILDLAKAWQAILLAVATVLLGRLISVHGVVPVSNLLSEKIPMRWRQILFWGGIHGSVSMALALSLTPSIPGRDLILTMTFGVVAFSIIVQGLTVKPFLRLLGMVGGGEDVYERAKVQHLAVSAARRELDDMLKSELISFPVFERLRDELETRLKETRDEISSLLSQNRVLASAEVKTARSRLLAAEKSAIQRSASDGLISVPTAEELLEAADERLEKLTEEEKAEREAEEKEKES